MKILYILIILTISYFIKFSNCHEQHQQQDDEILFIEWSRKYNKTYLNDEFHKRFIIFKDNLNFINQHNEINSYKLDLNELSDLTHEEVLIHLNLDNEKSFNHLFDMDNNSTMKTSKFIDEIDKKKNNKKKTTQSGKELVNWSMYTPWVKDQGRCGCCYTFSTIGALEGQINKKHGSKLRLSEQYLLDCTRPYGNLGCKGGLDTRCFNFILDNGGVVAEQLYPYQEGETGSCPSTDGVQLYGKIDRYVQLDSEELFIEALKTYGPISALIDGQARTFSNYKSGIYNDKSCGSSGKINHAVTVVGYGYDEETDQKYYIIKNSWSEKWGEGGFARIARDTCLLSQFGVTPILSS